MGVRISPRLLAGEIHAIPSKSILHRVLIASHLAGQNVRVSDDIHSEDINTTKNALKQLSNQDVVIDASESGSTLRFMIPIGLLKNRKIKFTGKGKLLQRPLQPYFDLFEKQGIEYSLKENQLEICGQLQAGEFYLQGDISSQFLTGLLFALPLLDGDSTLHITTPLESKGYVDMTIDVLKKFHIEVVEKENTYYVKGNQTYYYDKEVYDIENDYSQAAFFLAAGAMQSEVSVIGLHLPTLQPDAMILDILMKMKAMVLCYENKIEVISQGLQGIEIDGSQCIDLIPILCVLGSIAQGETRISHVGRLRYKESDRLHAIVTELTKLGAKIYIDHDDIVINGVEKLTGNVVYSHHDHRIAMALAMAATCCDQEVIIENSDCVKKSYPDFFEDYKKLGGGIDE